MSKVRKPAVAGAFYPANPQALKKELEEYFSVAPMSLHFPKAIIAPHAGTIYSGPIAASAYTCLKGMKDFVHRIVLLGPAHQVGFEGIAAPSVDFFETPLGKIPLDRKAIEEISLLPQVIEFEEAHAQEHSLEVHLPFLQMSLSHFQLIPLVVGWTEPELVAEVLEKLWGGKETLIIVSSDLSHYLSYENAQKTDEETARQIETLDWQNLADQKACGFFPVRGLLLEAQKKGLVGKILDLRNSGDIAGDKKRVVGYGAFHFYEKY